MYEPLTDRFLCNTLQHMSERILTHMKNVRMTEAQARHLESFGSVSERIRLLIDRDIREKQRRKK